MLDHDYGELFESWEIAIAIKLARSFADEQPHPESEDVEGLVQECLTRWVMVRDRYDATRGASRQTFMARVVRNKLRDMTRSRRTDKRKVNYVATSLDKPQGDDESSSTLADELDETTGLSERRSALSRIELRLDLEEAFGGLTTRQRGICLHLRDRLSITEISAILKTPRATIYDELKRIRSSFAKRGLKDYLS